MTAKQTQAFVLPESDAVLSCPLCMTTVCYDCQQHETVPTQFRAVFTVGCIADASEKLVDAERAAFHQVCCATCRCPLGLCDDDGITHFFHVLASESREAK
jgi:hypothetical protein